MPGLPERSPVDPADAVGVGEAGAVRVSAGVGAAGAASVGDVGEAGAVRADGSAVRETDVARVGAPDASGFGAAGTDVPRWRRALGWVAMAAVPWAICRVVVLGALALAHVFVSHAHPDAAVAARVHQGLLGWDAGWYRAIASGGYGGAGHQSLRFWPLFPLLGRAVALLPGVGVGAALLVVANACQLGGTALVAWLVADELGDVRLARRTAWLLSVVPAAFVSVMGYSEPTLLVLTAATIALLRRGRWWSAAGCGVLAGLCRPLGIALALPAAIEATRVWWEPRWVARRTPGPGGGIPRLAPVGLAGAVSRHERRASGRDTGGTAGTEVVGGSRAGRMRWSAVAARVAAVMAPVAGFGAFLVYSAVRFHDGLAPIQVQQEPRLHGRLTDPVVTVVHDLTNLLHGHQLGEGLHVPWLALSLVLLVVAARRLPASLTAFAALVLVAAVSGPNLDSFERYALSAFPLVVAGATLTASGRVERVVLTLSAAGLAAYALLAFLNIFVP